MGCSLQTHGACLTASHSSGRLGQPKVGAAQGIATTQTKCCDKKVLPASRHAPPVPDKVSDLSVQRQMFSALFPSAREYHQRLPAAGQ